MSIEYDQPQQIIEDVKIKDKIVDKKNNFKNNKSTKVNEIDQINKKITKNRFKTINSKLNNLTHNYEQFEKDIELDSINELIEHENDIKEEDEQKNNDIFVEIEQINNKRKSIANANDKLGNLMEHVKKHQANMLVDAESIFKKLLNEVNFNDIPNFNSTLDSYNANSIKSVNDLKIKVDEIELDLRCSLNNLNND